MGEVEVLLLSWLAVTVAAVPVMESDKRSLELECRFGNFCDQFVLHWRTR